MLDMEQHFNLEVFSDQTQPTFKNIFTYFFLTDFCKTVEIGVDQRLYVALTLFTGMH